MEWEDKDLQDLETAVELLESPGFIAKVSGLVGTPIEYVLDKLPKGAGDKITTAVHVSLRAAVNAAAITLGTRGRGRPWLKSHMAAAGLSGGVGGVFGLAALPIELPITTTIIMRSIADIARSEGEDLLVPEARLACLEVFAMGGPSAGDDATESGYFAVRAALARAVSEAAKYVAGRSVVEAPRECRWWVPSAGPPSTSSSSITSRIWRAGTSSCADSSGSTVRMRSGKGTASCWLVGSNDTVPRCPRDKTR